MFNISQGSVATHLNFELWLDALLLLKLGTQYPYTLDTARAHE